MEIKSVIIGQICPACRKDIVRSLTTRLRNGRYYVYAVHYYRDENGKRRTYECYLGPARGYFYVEKFNPLGLTGAHNVERFDKYLITLIKRLKREEFGISDVLDVLDEIISILAEKAGNDDEKKRIIVEKLKSWVNILEKREE